MPDLHIEVQRRHASNDAVVVEAVITGHHLGAWRGLPPTGRPTVLRQLGIFREPDRALGRITTIIMHPLTVAQTIWRLVFARRRA
jgi:hypothetical protein